MKITRQLSGGLPDPKIIAPEQEIQGAGFNGETLTLTVKHDGYSFTVALDSEDLAYIASFSQRGR